MKTLRLPAVRIQAATGKPRRLSIVGYTGGTMVVPGFGTIVVDLAGMELPTSLPLLADHRNELWAVVGSGKPTTDGKTLAVAGTVADTAAGLEVVALLEGGHSLQASIGADPLEVETVADGMTATVNQQKLAGPFKLIRRSVLREMTITPLGADPTTTVSLTAARAAGVATMPTFDAWIASLKLDPATLTEEQTTALKKQFDELFPSTTVETPAAASASWQGAQVLAEHAPQLIAQAGREKWSLARCQKEALDAVYKDHDYRHVSGMNARGNGNGGTLTANHFAAALMVRSGHEAAALKAFGAPTMEASRRLHSRSFVDLCEDSMRADGREPPRDRGRLIQAALSTGSMPVALGSSADKILEHTYKSAPATWRSWAAIRSAANFKVQSSVRPSFISDLENVPDGLPISHQYFEESVITWSIGQYAKQLRVGRKTIINNDLGAFAEVLPAMAKAAQRSLATLIYTALLANTGSHFGSGNANYASSGSSALSATSLAVALRKLRVQADAEGNILDLMPAVLLVPPEPEITARALLNSAELSRITSTDALPTGNSFQNLATLEVEPRLSSASFSGSSTTGWYLFATSADVPMIVGFLDGKETPSLETFGFDHESDRLEMSWRVVHDYGAALGDYRAGVFSTGA